MMTVVLWLGPLIELGILVGLVARRRLGRAVTLPCLLVALMASATTVGICPTCNTWDFWLMKEFAHAALLLLLGLELAQRAFVDEAARRAARRWTAFVIVSMLVLISTTGQGLLVVELLPRFIASVAWLYTGLSVVMLRYNTRIDPLHDTILTAFPAYLMIYATLWSQAAESTRMAALVTPPVQLGVLAALLYAAWMPPRAMDAPWVRRRWLGHEGDAAPRSDQSGTLHVGTPAEATT